MIYYKIYSKWKHKMVQHEFLIILEEVKLQNIL